MVVTEALARGIPALVASGTGAVEALGDGTPPGSQRPGAAIPPGDPAALSDAAPRWADEARPRGPWRFDPLQAL